MTITDSCTDETLTLVGRLLVGSRVAAYVYLGSTRLALVRDCRIVESRGSGDARAMQIMVEMDNLDDD